MSTKYFSESRVPRTRFADVLEAQEAQLKTDPIAARMAASRAALSSDPHRPVYHYVNPENTLNDPNGLCRWRGLWHLFYQARPPDDPRLHWGHAVSDDLVHWRDLPYALYPGPENDCYSGTTLVEDDRVIAMYHGTEIGNMVAVSSDPLLLNWLKLTGHAVIPFGRSDEAPKPYGVFDPCIWKKDGAYYALSAGLEPMKYPGRHAAANYLFRSTDLQHWEYLHPFVEGDRFTALGDDGACPYFLPIGGRHLLLFFSHMRGAQYLLGDYDRERDRFVADSHGRWNFGATFPGGVHAPSAAADDDGSVVVLFNMNPAKPTAPAEGFLKDFFDTPDNGDKTGTEGNWDQIITLPRRLRLVAQNEVAVEPIEAIESLRSDHVRVTSMVLPANEEIVLDAVRGNTIEMIMSVVPAPSSMLEVNLLRSAGKEEYTRVCFYSRRGNRYREPLANDARANRVMSTALSTPVRHESIVCIDTSHASVLPDVLARPPECAPVLIEPGAALELRILVDRSVVEVFVNGRQCLAVRVYPGRTDSVGVSLISRNRPSQLIVLDCWQMRSIYR